MEKGGKGKKPKVKGAVKKVGQLSKKLAVLIADQAVVDALVAAAVVDLAAIQALSAALVPFAALIPDGEEEAKA